MIKENRQMELLITFYKNMGEDKNKIFTLDYFHRIVNGKIDLSERLIDHYFGKLEDMEAIRPIAITLNDAYTFRLSYVVTDLLKELEA